MLGFNYLLLGLVSLAMLIYALRHIPNGGSPPPDDDRGGLPLGGDSSPSSDLPPSLVVNAPDDQPEKGDPVS